MVAGTVAPSENTTLTDPPPTAAEITWLLVRMYPSDLITSPDPLPPPPSRLVTLMVTTDGSTSLATDSTWQTAGCVFDAFRTDPDDPPDDEPTEQPAASASSPVTSSACTSGLRVLDDAARAAGWRSDVLTSASAPESTRAAAPAGVSYPAAGGHRCHGAVEALADELDSNRLAGLVDPPLDGGQRRLE